MNSVASLVEVLHNYVVALELVLHQNSVKTNSSLVFQC